MFCKDGPIEEKPYFNNYQLLYWLDEKLPVPGKNVELVVKGDTLSVDFRDNHSVNLEQAYKAASKEEMEKISEAVRRMSSDRARRRIQDGFKSGTLFGLFSWLELELSKEKDVLEQGLIRRARAAINMELGPRESASSGGPFTDGDGAYRDAPGWGGHSAG